MGVFLVCLLVCYRYLFVCLFVGGDCVGVLGCLFVCLFVGGVFVCLILSFFVCCSVWFVVLFVYQT